MGNQKKWANSKKYSFDLFGGTRGKNLLCGRYILLLNYKKNQKESLVSDRKENPNTKEQNTDQIEQFNTYADAGKPHLIAGTGQGNHLNGREKKITKKQY